MQWLIERKAKATEGTGLPELEPAIENKLKERGKVLLYFFSPTCGPCRKITPVIDQMSNRFDNVFKFNITRSAELPRRLGVMATPSILLLADGKISRVIIGPTSMMTLEDLLA